MGHRLLLWWSTGSRQAGFSSCSAWLLGSWASVAAAQRLRNCGAGAYLLRGRIEPLSPALAGRFLTTAPPGKFPVLLFSLSDFNEIE